MIAPGLLLAAAILAASSPSSRAADNAEEAAPKAAAPRPAASPRPRQLPPARRKPTPPAAGVGTQVPEPTGQQPEPQPRFRQWGASLSANIPHPIWLDGTFRLERHWSFALGLGGLNLSLPMKNSATVDLKISAIDARARWHPWGGSFFLGLALGAQQLSGAGTDPVPVTVAGQTVSVDTTVKVSINSAYATPHLGWLWIWDSGFNLGFELGVQKPFSSKTQVDISTSNNVANVAIDVIQQTQAYKDLNSAVQDAGDQIGNHWLPYVTVLRLGWYF